MVAGVADVKIAARVERDAPWIIELAGSCASAAEQLDRLVVRIKDLDAAIAELTDELPPIPVNTDIIGITHLTRILTRPPVGAQPFSGWGKDLDTMIAGIGHMDLVL